jgi:hypothetical protein
VSVYRRLSHWIREHEVLDPSFDELAAAATGNGPIELLEFDPSTMTLWQWSRALFQSRRTQPWLTFFCWHALGFRAASSAERVAFTEWIDDKSVKQESIGLMMDTTNLLQKGVLLGGEPSATLVLFRRTRSQLAAWHPDSEVAVLVVTVEDLPELRSRASGALLRLPRTPLSVCAVEMKPEIESELYTAQLPTIKMVLGGGYLVYVYPVDQGREMKSPRIVGPDSLDMIFTAAVDGDTSLPDPPLPTK